MKGIVRVGLDSIKILEKTYEIKVDKLRKFHDSLKNLMPCLCWFRQYKDSRKNHIK